MRQNQVIREEGYDGEYGTIRLFEEAERDALVGQFALFQAPKRKKPGPKKELTPDRIAAKTKETPKDVGQTFPSDPILGPLNPEQKEAVLHCGGHLIIVAGPGTGKTMTLSHRIAHLIRSGQISPSQVLALTFTNKAAREMEERISNLIPEQRDGAVWVSTFHGFCLQVLRKEGESLSLSPSFNVCSELDVPILVKQVLSESGGEKRITNKLLKDLPRLKMASIMADKTDSDLSDLLPYFQRYQQKLRELGMLDLDDLQVEVLRLFYEEPEKCGEYAESFPWIFVDEYQDTNRVQVALLKALIQIGSGKICAIGDPDQAIYGFRGANVQNFFRFSEDFPGAKQIKLSRNYRSSQVILSGSSGLMRRAEPLKGVLEEGDPIRFASCHTHTEEAEMIVEQIEKLMGGTTYFSLDSGRVSSHEDGEDFSFGDIALLFRLNAQGDALQEALSRAGIPFIRSGETPLINRYPVNVVWRFFHALQYPESPYHLRAYLDLPDMKNLDAKEILTSSEIGDSLEDLIDQAITLHGFDLSSEESAEALRRLKAIAGNFQGTLKSFLDALSLERGIDHATLSGDRVALMSLHAAKGLEWPVVFITGCEDGLIPCTLFGDLDEEEEKRIFYVGMTRARSKLILSHANRRTIHNRVLQMNPSPFLDLIPEEFCGPLERTGWKRKGKAHKQLGLF
jgi:superfamily I DNA/RNA helicase